MTEKKYLKWYNKVGYGSGDMAANMIYGMLTSFVMIYLTDTVGMSAGICGTLIMFSKFLDGITDVFFGMLIDKTHSRMGKARPWMLYSSIGNALMLTAVFAIPSGIGEKAQYAYFFIAYTLLNAVFYTANNIAYASLTSLVTKNGDERVQMGSIRFMFSMITNIGVLSLTVRLVQMLGGGAAGWRNVAVIYGIISVVVNTISVFSVKELPVEEPAGAGQKQKKEKPGLLTSLRLLLSNKYFILIALIYILMYLQIGGITGAGVYYMTYVMGNPALLGTFSFANMGPMILGLILTPALVKRFHGIYKVNLLGAILAVIFRFGFIAGGYAGSIPLMLAFSILAGFATGPLTGTMNALISAISDYTVRTTGHHIEGAMFSCSSLGIKIGSGLGSALAGILLELGGYVANAKTQPPSCISMLHFIYLWLPLIIISINAVLLYLLKVEKANAEWDRAHAVSQE